jgi:polynucleotide 5'-hydroxyl-kinase GRC3/NOL9
MIDDIARRAARGRVTLFLGNVDVGKSTLIRALHDRIGGEVVDADVGQSSLGPPAVVSLGVPAQESRAGYFVGDVTPSRSPLAVLTGTAKMAARARSPCLIDTDGYIKGPLAWTYKSELVSLIQPQTLVLLERERELEHYRIYSRKGIDVVNIKVHHGAYKNPQERLRHREEAFRRCFNGAKIRRVSFRDVKVERAPFGNGRPLAADKLARALGVPVRAAWKSNHETLLVADGILKQALPDKKGLRVIHASEIQNLLMGCLYQGEFQGLAILKKIESHAALILTRVKRVNVLQAGFLQVHEDGSHSRIRPHLFEPEPLAIASSA